MWTKLDKYCYNFKKMMKKEKESLFQRLENKFI